MFVHTRRSWALPESAVTPESLVLGRRAALAGVAAGALLAGTARARADGLTPDPRFPPGRAITAETAATTYNNYYEFSEDKDLWRAAQKLPQSPWSIRIEGEVDQPRTIAFEDLMKQVKLDERVYRHRCVEAW